MLNMNKSFEYIKHCECFVRLHGVFVRLSVLLEENTDGGTDVRCPEFMY